MSKPVLSILTPAIPERFAQLTALRDVIERQQAALPLGSVEWLIFCDTRGARTIGQKRDDLVQLARGEYVAFVDDDDSISPDYLQSLYEAATAQGTPADVITFRQLVTYNGATGEVLFRLGAHNEPFTPNAFTNRAPWHVCAFRASLAKAHHFPHTNYGEDWEWARHVGADCKSSVHIDRILHHYMHDASTTAAPEPPRAS
jgi:hypothetical protein